MCTPLFQRLIGGGAFNDSSRQRCFIAAIFSRIWARVPGDAGVWFVSGVQSLGAAGVPGTV